MVLAILIPFVIANEVIRWTWKRNFPATEYFVRNWQLSYSLRPDFHKRVKLGLLNLWVWQGKDAYWELNTNAQGLRHPKEINPQKTGNTFRIICLGDSVTFGQDVDDQYTYSSQLEQILAQSFRNRFNIEVINAGVPGYSSRQGLIYSSSALSRLNPDLLVLEFGLNDNQNVLISSMVRDKKLFPGDIRRSFKKIYRSPYFFSYIIFEQPIFSMLRYYGTFVSMALFQQKINKARENPSATLKSANPSKWLNTSRVPVNDYFDNLTQFQELAEQNHCRLMFYLPYGLPPNYKRVLLTFAYENKIPVVDFSQRLASYKYQALSENPVYARLLEFYVQKLGADFLKKYPEYLLTVDGGHPNAVGNRIIAEEMARTIIADFFRPLNQAPAPVPEKP
jgi:lysophospholipase L1-like esterase